MATIVLRVSGSQLDVSRCLALIPVLDEGDCYRAGQPQRRGGVHAESGFALTLADLEENDAAVKQTAHRLTALAQPLAELLQHGAGAELDCGLFVHAMAMQSIALPAPLLVQLGAAGIAVRVSAYPTADE